MNPRAIGKIVPAMATGDTRAVEKGLKDLLKAVNSKAPANVGFNYTNRDGLTEEQYRRLRNRDLMDVSRMIARF